MSKNVRKILNNILNVITTIMVVILCIGIISSFQTSFLGKKYNSFFGYTLFEIKTASMAGYTEIGDWILVKIDDEISLGDVVTFEEDGAFVTHRVIEIYNDTYVTKGDSNSSTDVPVNKSQIIGKVHKVLPHLGFIKKTILNTKVIVLLLITIVLGNSLFVKEKSDKNIMYKLKNMFIEEKEEKEKESKKKEKVKKQEKVVENNNVDKQVDLYDKYPSLKQLEKTKDPSKTVVLSKIIVKKSKNFNEMKSLLEDENFKKVKTKKQKRKINSDIEFVSYD